MESYQERAVVEHSELRVKVDRLTAFVSSKKFREVDYLEQERLRDQLRYMEKYLSILNERITAFKGEQQ